MTNAEEMEVMMAWCKAHRFPVKQVKNVLYWRTNYQTAEYDTDTQTTVWHSVEYFDSVKVKN